jgi:serine/threonine protein kinase
MPPSVDRVLSLISFKEYARKRVLRSAAFRGRKKEEVQQFIAEIGILKRLKHRHIVEFVGSYTDAKYIGLIMSPIAEGDLGAYMARATPAKYPELRTFFGCLAAGLEYLHDNTVRHKDIKPGNILVSNGKILYADFGLSLDFTDATGSTTMSMVNGMTPRYCSPEVAMQEPRNTKSDIWSLGVVYLEMSVTIAGKPVQYIDDFFRERGAQQVNVRANLDNLPELLETLCVPEYKLVEAVYRISDMLKVAQDDRPTASALTNAITTPTRDGEDKGLCGICCMVPEEEDFSDYGSE